MGAVWAEGVDGIGGGDESAVETASAVEVSASAVEVSAVEVGVHCDCMCSPAVAEVDMVVVVVVVDATLEAASCHYSAQKLPPFR